MATARVQQIPSHAQAGEGVRLLNAKRLYFSQFVMIGRQTFGASNL